MKYSRKSELCHPPASSNPAVNTACVDEEQLFGESASPTGRRQRSPVTLYKASTRIAASGSCVKPAGAGAHTFSASAAARANQRSSKSNLSIWTL